MFIKTLKYLPLDFHRLERLQRLAEKIHRESKQSEDSLADIDRRIRDEERRVEILHPFEAKRNCDALERALKTIEDTVRSLLRDAQALQDARYTNSDQMYKRLAYLFIRVIFLAHGELIVWYSSRHPSFRAF